MKIDVGGWVDFKGYRLYVEGLKDMSKEDVVKYCGDLLRSGWMHRANWLTELATKDKK